jgi:hypothetical protein
MKALIPFLLDLPSISFHSVHMNEISAMASGSPCPQGTWSLLGKKKMKQINNYKSR